jgi:ABC-type sugar transport system permease subunit
MQAIVVSLKYVIGTVLITIPLGYVYSLILTASIRGVIVFRSIILIPWIISQVVIALLWKWFLDGTYGPLIYYLSRLNIKGIQFLGEKFALHTLVFANVWRTFPFAMVMLLASLQTIPGEIYESAKVDGANGFQVFWKITFPFTISTLLITIIMVTLESFNMVTLINTLTAGGPLAKTETLSLRVYKETFQNWRLDYATTTGVIILLFNIVFSLGYITLLRRKE